MRSLNDEPCAVSTCEKCRCSCRMSVSCTLLNGIFVDTQPQMLIHFFFVDTFALQIGKHIFAIRRPCSGTYYVYVCSFRGFFFLFISNVSSQHVQRNDSLWKLSTIRLTIVRINAEGIIKHLICICLANESFGLNMIVIR